MYKVKIENPCGCFFKSGLPEEQSFDDKAAAKAEAQSLLEHMQKNFCKKHEFGVLPSGTTFKVVISKRS
jgi:hypothetical protein